MSLALVHAKYQFLETVRIPIAVIASAFFPSASMLFFVVPFVGSNAVGATMATGSMVTFSVMMTCLFTYGVGVSEDRAQPWDPYTRTLPVGPLPRLVGRLLNGLAFSLLALIPVLVIAATLTSARVSVAQLVAGVGAVLVTAVPFTLMGLAIGYLLPSKAALAVTNILFFPLAFGGGLLMDPQSAPGFIETIAPYLPTRGSVELVWAAIADFSPNPTALIMLGVWIVACGGLATFAYRRDEGRRFS